jgi:pimeloyl-ACP methyl ester carboxylesterase
MQVARFQLNGLAMQVQYLQCQGRLPDATTFVFLHGIGASSAGWIDVLAYAGSIGANAVAWNAPGYGGSTALPGQQPSAQQYAEVLWSWLESLSLTKVHLVGHSMGAIIASKAAALRPDRIAALTLLAPARGYASAPAAVRASTRDERLNAADRLGMSQLAQQRASVLLAPDAPADAVAQTRNDLAQVPIAGYQQATHMLANSDLIPDLLAWRAVTQAPLQIACGDLDLITPPKACEKIAFALNKPLISLGATGHMCPVEATESVCQLLF